MSSILSCAIIILHFHRHSHALLIMPGKQASKPSRSDELRSQDEQSRITEKVRLFFESSAPKRHPKPSRSESMEDPPASGFYPTLEIPEYLKFQHLEASDQENAHASCHDEFVETDYYKDLSAADKNLHYTTGTGYIQMDANGASKLHLNGSGVIKARIRCNPAMNDWIPSLDVAISTTNKPPRSDP